MINRAADPGASPQAAVRRGLSGHNVVLAQAAIDEAERPVAVLRHLLVMGHDEDGGVLRVGERAQQFDDRVGRLMIVMMNRR